MKKTKRKAVINLIIFFLLLAGGIYMAIAGVGQNESGKTANVPLGLNSPNKHPRHPYEKKRTHNHVFYNRFLYHHIISLCHKKYHNHQHQ